MTSTKEASSRRSLLHISLALAVGLVMMLIFFRGFLTTPLNDAMWGISISADPVGNVSVLQDVALERSHGCAGHTTTHSYPFGALMPIDFAYYLAPSFQSLFFFQWLTGKAIMSYNLAIILTFALNYALSYLIFYLLLGDGLVAIVPALIVTFNAYTISHSWAHLGLIDVCLFPCFFYAFGKIQTNKSYSFAVLAALIAALALYSSPYFFYFIAWSAVAMLAGFFVLKPRQYADRRLLAANALCALATAVFIIPFISDEYLRDFTPYWRQAFSSANYGNDMHYLFASTARPSDYILPNTTHFLYGDFFTRFITDTMPGRDKWSDEFPISIGVLPAVFCLLMLGTLIISYRSPTKSWVNKLKKITAPIHQAYKEQKPWFLGFLFVMAVSFLLSLPPTIEYFGIKIPTPTEYLRHLVPFRSYSRFAIVFLTALAGLIGFALCRSRGRVWWVALFIAITAFENTPRTMLHPASVDIPYIKYLRERPEQVLLRFERQNVSFKRPIDLEVLLTGKPAINGPVNMFYGYTDLSLVAGAEKFNLGYLGAMGAELLIINGRMNPTPKEQPYLERLQYFPESDIEIWKIHPVDDPVVTALFKPYIEARKKDACYVGDKAEVQRTLAQFYQYLKS